MVVHIEHICQDPFNLETWKISDNLWQVTWLWCVCGDLWLSQADDAVVWCLCLTFSISLITHVPSFSHPKEYLALAIETCDIDRHMNELPIFNISPGTCDNFERSLVTTNDMLR